MPKNKSKETFGELDDVDFGEGEAKKPNRGGCFYVNKSCLPLDTSTWERMWDHVSDIHPDGTRIQYSIRHEPCLPEVSTVCMLLVISPPSVWEQSVLMSMSVFVSVCLPASTSLELHVQSMPHLCAYYLWPWLDRPMVALHCFICLKFWRYVCTLWSGRGDAKRHTQSDLTGAAWIWHWYFSNLPLADVGFLEGGGDFGNPSDRSERALRGSGFTGEWNFSICRQDLARGWAQNDIEIT